MQALIVASLLGFPVAVVLAWFYEWTPEGIKSASDAEAANGADLKGRKLEFVIIGLLVLAVGFLVVDSQLTEELAPFNSVAVLPFENLSPDPDDAYFAAGIHRELLAQLAKVDDLQIIARASVMKYEGEQYSVAEVASNLNVRTIVEGSVRYAENDVRVTAQLTNTDLNTQVWAEVYERSLEDIFAIQADIAERIVESLKAELTESERQSIARRPTESPEAYALYLQGLAAYPDNPLVVNFMQQAVAVDPSFSLAYARNAWAHIRFAQSVTGVLEHPDDRNEHAGLARQAAEKALMLDPTLGYGHAQLARINVYEMKWAGERQALERAFDLSPNDPSVLQAYALQLAYSGDAVSARRMIDRARELDPGSRSVQLGLVHIALNDWDAAVAALHEITSIAGTPQPFAYLELGYAEGARGNHGEAIEAIRIAERLSVADTRPSWIARLARAYARAGDADAARRLARVIQEKTGSQYVSATTWYVTSMALGDYDEAVTWLHAAIDRRDTYGEHFRQMETRHDVVDQIWEYPRFQDARRKLGFR